MIFCFTTGYFCKQKELKKQANDEFVKKTNARVAFEADVDPSAQYYAPDQPAPPTQ